MSRGAVGALAALLLAGCATPGGQEAGPQPDGERLYRSHCGSCHRLRSPSEHTPEAWGGLVFRYAARAHLTAEEERLVLEYLQGAARP